LEIKRHLEEQLNQWRQKENRKPLVLRGARQVGKTTLIKSFSKNYPHSILLNLERKGDRSLFDDHDEVKPIIETLFLQHNLSVNKLAQTLLFIDEIQESPKAIELLRYFYEEFPSLHVIAAGSLLEFALSEVESMPVGRVEYLYMYPLNFKEYLEAASLMLSLNYLNQVPIENVAHKALKEQFHNYAIVGGMPEIVANFLRKKSLTNLPPIYESIWSTYKEDVEKYGTNKTSKNIISHIINSAHLYVNERIKFQNFGQSNYKSREVGEAMRQLDKAKVIRLIYPTTDWEVPIKEDLKKSPRLQMLDTGLLNHNLNIQAELLTLDDLNNAFKGAIIPHLVTQEILSLNNIKESKPNFWVREKRQASAEVDLIISQKGLVIPIEIKSGAVGKLKSLHQFMNVCNHPYAIRMSANTFSIEKVKTNEGIEFFLMNLPYYLSTKVPEYIDYFIENYKL